MPEMLQLPSPGLLVDTLLANVGAGGALAHDRRGRTTVSTG
jgi:hypothetical protein